jgi:predicted MFS family arabinose efflux permease
VLLHVRSLAEVAFRIGLCTTNSFAAFSAISFFTAITTVTPQIMLPLVGDLAPPHKRAMALSIVTSGNALGVLLARILSGIVTQYTSWRNIYWLALGLQYLIFSLLWLFMPDYPSTNPGGLNYFKMLWSILTLCKKHAVLMQAGLVSYCTSLSFTNFWTTLTFLLAGSPYHYDSLIIGLFALVGIAGMVLAPVYARLLINPFVPLFSVIVGEAINITGITIGTYTGKFTIAGPIIQAFGTDAGLLITQIANRSAIYAVEPKGRNRLNTAFMLMTFLGQLTGTSAGNKIYAQGGWVASGSLSVGFIAFSFLVCAARGPFETRWFGWGGGWSIRKKHKNSADGRGEEKRSELMPKEKEDVETNALERSVSNTDKALEG